MGRGQSGIHYFCAGTEDHTYFGHAWRLWAHGTSFYVSARAPEIADIKFSLHGPDPRPGTEPVFKLALARRAMPGGSRAALVDRGLPMAFAGAAVAPGVRHVIRFRFRPALYDGSVPNGIGFDKGVGSSPALFVPVPEQGQVADLDCYVSDQEPHIPPGALQSRAVIGPIANDAGQSLTGIVSRRNELLWPTPLQAFAMPPQDKTDALRGVWTGKAGCAFAWVVETRLSRRAHLDGLSQPPAWLTGRTTQADSRCVPPPPWGWMSDRSSGLIPAAHGLHQVGNSTGTNDKTSTRRAAPSRR